MAKTTNILTQGLKGMVGKQMVFRTWNGNTYISVAPKKPKKQSPLQKENRMKFRKATGFAKAMMKDPVKKAEYQEIAKKLKLPNAYTAAITEYMRKPEIHEIDTSAYQGKEGDSITIMARKKSFEVQEIEVIIVDKDGVVIEQGKATKGLGWNWNYKATVASNPAEVLQFVVKAKDRAGNITEKKSTRPLLE